MIKCACSTPHQRKQRWPFTQLWATRETSDRSRKRWRWNTAKFSQTWATATTARQVRRGRTRSPLCPTLLNGFRARFTVGVFTAPVKGVYLFQFTAFGYTSCTIRLDVYKNNKKVMSNWKHSQKNVATYVPNSFILELEDGDTVDFRLPLGACLYDDANNYSTVSGSLL